MFKSFQVGRIYGIPIKLDITFLVILPIFAWVIALQTEQLVELLNMTMGTELPAGTLSEGRTPWILGLIAAIGLFACVLAHELGHSVAAIRYGFPIDSITLWLLGGVAQLTEQPRDWREELIIAIAGPAVSVGLGVGLWMMVLVIPSSFESLIFIVAYLALMNIILAAFNMLPGFPMDGGRVLRALLARKRPFEVATAQAAQVGKLFAIGLGLFGLLMFNFILIAVALFIYIAASGEARYTALRHAVEGINVRDLMTPVDRLDVVTPDLSIAELLEIMWDQRHSGYPVVDENGIAGVITLDDIRGVKAGDRRTTQVSDVMTTSLTTIGIDDEAIDAIEAMQRNNIGRLIVVDRSGNLAGLVTRTDIVRAISLGVMEPGAGPEPSPEFEQLAAASRPRW